MDASARIPEPLQWYEGMLLTPQHFQQSDIYWHSLMRHIMMQLEPHYWGLIDVDLDDAAIKMGKIHIKHVHAVMPDGLTVQYPAPGQSEVLFLDVSNDAALRANKPLKIHLAVPVRAEGAASSASAIQRYDSVKGALEMDENTGENHVEVCRLRPRVTLLAGDKLPAKYITLPLLQLRRDIGGHFDLTEFHPPLLRTGASRFLGDPSLIRQLQALATRVRAKAKELAGTVGTDAGSNTTNVYHKEVVRRLAAALPVLEVLVRAETTHPFQLYQALAQLTGNVAGIGADPVPLLLDAYQHDDAAPGFFKAIRHVAAILAKLNAAYELVAFERPRSELFVCPLAPAARTDRLIIELKPQAGQTPQALAQWLGQAFVGAESMIPLLRQRRLPGARVRPLPADQLAALGVSGGTLYEVINQAIEQDEKLVPVIQPGAPLHIHGPATQPPAAIVLYSPNRADKKPETAARAAHV